MRLWNILALCTLTVFAAETSSQRTAGKYQITLRLPADGLYAQEEDEIEFRVEDTSRADPLLGNTPVIRARIEVHIDMPSMPGMPSFTEIAHPEGVPGDYGVHPTFAHGGDFRLRMIVNPPEDSAFEVEFPIAVLDAGSQRNRARRPPRFTLDLTASPKSPKPGDAVSLRLAVRENSREVFRDFERAHEEFMHLVIVRDDLRYFSHEHPVLGANGAFTMQYQFLAPGEYHLFADVAPKAAGSQVLMTKLRVSGKAPGPTPGDQKIEDARVVPAKRTVPITFAVGPIPGLQPYLGARAHLIAIHEDAVTFVHSHPDESQAFDGAFTFLGRFPRAGRYHAWLQFKQNDRVETREFLLDAKDN